MAEVKLEPKLVRIRLKGLAGKHDNFEALKKMTGYRLVREGNDYVVLDDDPKLREKRPNFLGLGHAIDIRKASAAEELVAEFDKAVGVPPHIKMPNAVGVIEGLGFYSKLDNAARSFFFAPLGQLPGILHERVFPFAEEHRAFNARAAIVDFHSFYSRVSIPKLTFLISQFGIEQAEDIILKKGILTNILPSAFEPREIFDALLIFPPYLAGWSFHRPDSALVFLPETISIFDYRLFKTLPDHLVPEAQYLDANGERAIIDADPSARDVSDLIEIFSEATNEFWDFFTRPLLWLNEEGVFDELRLIKAMALGRLLVADVSAIQRSSSSFARTRLMFQFFDKFAQLCFERANVSGNRIKVEARWASYLMGEQMLDLICRIFRYHHRVQRKRIFQTLAKFAEQIKYSIGRDIAEMHSAVDVPQSASSGAAYVRLLRNLAHGTFLSGDQFERQFLKANPHVPVDAHRLPWLYLLAFSLDPTFFMTKAGAILPSD